MKISLAGQFEKAFKAGCNAEGRLDLNLLGLFIDITLPAEAVLGCSQTDRANVINTMVHTYRHITSEIPGFVVNPLLPHYSRHYNYSWFDL
jgi:hypothetical protein